ncbi:Putative uncharacterized protein [Moritella viscosa]|uniref:DUF4062 domain-containing protein n=1 Tax=Moritella viscosa TaxID=80854 RepID=UPI0009103AA6|nr:DUF4062 domain-containing protein [Moritella viscosa]SHO23895.1 Putative uncharacterized protein [Moritella viscosa]
MKKKLQVFVSSTFEDLKEERQSAVSTILEAGHIPAGMELFSATDKTQKEVIKKWIDESDVYMLILGGRYGSMDPETGTSYTEWEYNYATDTGKPLFAVVINEDALDAKIAKDGKSVMEQENPAKLKEFKSVVLSNMTSFFSDNKDIKLAIWQSITELNGRENLVGWVSGSEVRDDTELLKENAKLEGKIENLISENESLKEKLEEQSKAVMTAPANSGYDFEKLAQILESKTFYFAPKDGEKQGKGINGLDMFKRLRKMLVTGVESNNLATGYYFTNVCPDYKLYGLLNLEDSPRAARRRFDLSEKGAGFLVYLDEKAMNKKESA